LLERLQLVGAGHRLTRTLGALVLFGILSACGSRASSHDGASRPIDECEALLAAQGQCLSSTGAGAGAAGAVEATRESLYGELARHPESRATLTARCVEETARLKISCQ
jgi:hypothetical protein